MKNGYVYIMSNPARTTLYIGVTSDLKKRVYQHKSLNGSTFTRKYVLTDLLYYEEISGMPNAIKRETQLKNWHKEWKWNLIKSVNPNLLDLSLDWYE